MAGRSLGRRIKDELSVYRFLLQDPRTPRRAKILLGVALGYAVTGDRAGLDGYAVALGKGAGVGVAAKFFSAHFKTPLAASICSLSIIISGVSRPPS